jgi:hypothetical protein
MTTTCPHCGQDVPEQPALPLARRLGIQHCGRALFTIDGKIGMFCGREDFMDKQDGLEVERIEVNVDEPCRGRPRRKTLYAMPGLTKELQKALGLSLGDAK